MSRFVLLSAACFLLHIPLFAAELFTVDGRVVRVETERYRVTFDGLALTAIENRLTGETYAAAAGGQDDAAGITIQSLRPGVPNRFWTVGPKTAIAAEKGDGGAVLRCAGLHCGEDFDPRLEVALRLAVEGETGDLVIAPEARAAIEAVIGVRDRGLLNCRLHFGPLAENLRLILPASDGFSVTRHTVKEDWSWGARWPQHWEAALCIAEAEQGCMALWADEPQLHYGRSIAVKRSGGWHIGLAFETARRIEESTAIEQASWRFNVWEGYWAKAAARYVAQMETQWPDLDRFAERGPAWANSIRIWTMPTPSAAAARKYSELVPRDTIAVFTCQEWLRGWNGGEIRNHTDGPMDYFPNWPLENPTHYEGEPWVAERWPPLQKLGFHLFPYTNPTIITHKHPWLRQKIAPRNFFGYRIWQRLYPELVRPIVERYGVTGIYEDCSWVINRHKLGTPEENWYNGGVRMRTYFRKLMPEVAVCGERNNEVTARGQRFALSLSQWTAHAHPINAYLFSPFLRMWNINQQPRGFDADDIRGWLTKWPASFEASPMQDRLMIRKRGVVFAREQLVSHWPESWDKAVMHYFRATDGTEYRFVRDRGTRFVRLGAGGETTIYWRLHGVDAVEVKTGGVAGWVGYNGAGLIGLQPSKTYFYFDEVKRPPVTLAQLPPGVVIRRCVVRDGYWAAELVSVDREAGTETGAVRVRVPAGEKVHFSGAKAVRETGDGGYELKVALPAGLAAWWSKPIGLEHGEALGGNKTINHVHRMATGLVSRHGPVVNADTFNLKVGATDDGEEGSVPWLVTIPEFGFEGEDTTFLVFKYGSQHAYGDGANYKVRVNGRVVWERYRPEVGKPDPKTREPQPIELTTGAVDLTPWAGQTIVLELCADGNRTSVSEVVRWHYPRLETTAPGDAEMDGRDTSAVGPRLDPGGLLTQ